MKVERPRFELSRVYSDGKSEKPEIISVGKIPLDTQMERRGFLGVGVGIASLLFLLDGKSEAKDSEHWEKQETKKQDDVSAKAPAESIAAHFFSIKGLAVSASGKTLVTIGDEYLKTWVLPSGKFALRRKIMTEDDAGNALAIAPNGKTVFVSYSPNRLRAFSLPALTPLGSFKGIGEGEEITSLAVTPNNQMLVGVSDSNQIKLWALPSRRLVATLKGHTGHIGEIAITPDGKILASASDDKTIKLWSLADFQQLAASIEGHTKSVNTLAITADGTQLITGSEDETIKIWSLPDGKLIKSISDKIGSVRDLAVNPNDRLFTAKSYSEFINLWSLPEGKKITTFEAHSKSLEMLEVTPDGKLLISGHNDGVVCLWDLVKQSFRSYLFDRAANDTDTKGVSYNSFDKITGSVITYTLPCGSPIPKGAVCTCNCVRGTYREPSYDGGGSYTYCTCNKICTCIPVPSDREVKESFETTDATTILQKLSEIPINKWNYKWDDESIRHIGPMAQDFAKAFEVGDSDKHIYPVDANGVAFAAIQGLYQMLKAKEVETKNLQKLLEKQQEDSKALQTRIEKLEQLSSE